MAFFKHTYKNWKLLIIVVIAFYVCTVYYDLMDNILSKDNKQKRYFTQTHTAANKKQEPTNRFSSLQQELQLQYEQFLLSANTSMRNCHKSHNKRNKRLSDLGQLVDERINNLQHPTDCNSVKLLVYVVTWSGSGYGFNIHKIAGALILAYASNRTLVFKPEQWRYPPGGWGHFHLPITKCAHEQQTNTLPELDPLGNSKVVYLKTEGWTFPYTQGIPLDIARELVQLHQHPYLWWVSRFVKYVLRLQPQVENAITKLLPKIDESYVGLHIRRTDKVSMNEAKYFKTQQYIEVAEKYFSSAPQGTVMGQRKLYVATDDVSVLPDVRMKYPEYKFYGNVSIAITASEGQRHSETAMYGFWVDVFMLLQADYIVCTMSSNVCRIVYELMQATVGDATDCVHSLDSDYFFVMAKHGPIRIAKQYHKSSVGTVMELYPGDLISWHSSGKVTAEGENYGINMRTGIVGPYEVNKTVHYIQIMEGLLS